MALQFWSAIKEKLKRELDNQFVRHDFVIAELRKLPANSSILDAGCGSQRYRQYCAHLLYKAQDFGKYIKDEKKSFTDSSGGTEGYRYGELDYVGNIWNIEEADGTFDSILCTEVLEHVPYPNETLKEFGRLLKPGGKLILTAPSNCLRHMDPYYFYSGFSDRWFEKFLSDNGLRIEYMEPVGDYYRWLAVEMARTAHSHSIFAKMALVPAFLYFFNQKKTAASVDALCMGYHVVATRQ